MENKPRKITFLSSIILFSALAIYSHLTSSEWIIDNLLTILLIGILYSLNKWLDIDVKQLLMIDFGLLLHNLGMFGFYSFNMGILAYDNIVHMVGSIITAFIIMDIMKNKKSSSIVLAVILALSATIALGAMVEVIEYSGFVLFGSGEGILLYGVGDYEKFGESNGQYKDTMKDIIVNSFGAVIGISLSMLYKTGIKKSKKRKAH